ncbi:unnamed protein product [Burkholderia pseudomallei]|nr:unnamed protein product [Burkholderia pseudomallei]
MPDALIGARPAYPFAFASWFDTMARAGRRIARLGFHPVGRASFLQRSGILQTPLGHMFGISRRREMHIRR